MIKKRMLLLKFFVTIITISIIIGSYILMFILTYGEFNNEEAYRNNIDEHIVFNNLRIGQYITVRINNEKVVDINFTHQESNLRTIFDFEDRRDILEWENNILTVHSSEVIYTTNMSKEEYLDYIIKYNLNLDRTNFKTKFMSFSLNKNDNFVQPIFSFFGDDEKRITFDYLDFVLTDAKIYFYVSTSSESNMSSKLSVYCFEGASEGKKIEIIVTPFRT